MGTKKILLHYASIIDPNFSTPCICILYSCRKKKIHKIPSVIRVLHLVYRKHEAVVIMGGRGSESRYQ